MTEKQPKTTKKTTKKTKKPVAKKTAPKEVVLVEKEWVDDYGEFLQLIDEKIVEDMARGKTDEEIKKRFGIDNEKLSSLRANPTFVKTLTTKLMSTGVTNKNERIAKLRRITSKIDDEMMQRLEDGKLQNESFQTLFNFWMNAQSKLETLLGEDGKKEQNINIVIHELVKQKSKSKADNFDEYDPTNDFPVVDVESEEIKKKRK